MAKILIVDDQAPNRALIVTLVHHAGHEALEAADGADALQLVRAERPALVISDILMPTMDGYEFVRQLRADPALAATRVIFYSAYYQGEEARSLALAGGVSEVLVKPCEPQDILSAIERTLAQAAQASRDGPLAQEQAFRTQHLRLVTDKLRGNVVELEATNRRLAALTELNLQLASERDPVVLLNKVCAGARELIGAQYAVLCAVRKPGEASLVCTSGIDPGLARSLPAPDASSGLLGRLQLERRSQRLLNPGGDPTLAGLPPGYPPLYCALEAPVASLASSYGWICLANKQGAEHFSAEDERILSILAAQVGRIYENGSLYLEVQRHAEQLHIEVIERRRALEELRASEAGLHRAQLLARITHVISGPGGRFESWPATLAQMLRREPDAMPASAREWITMVYAEDRALVRGMALKAVREGVRMDFTYRLWRADGALLHLRQVMEPLHEDGATTEGLRWFNTIQDVTAQKRAEEALRESDRRFNELLDKVEMASLMLDRNGCITYCNDCLLRLSGWERGEIFGRNWFELFLPPGMDGMQRVFEDMLADRPATWHFEQEILTRAGGRRLVYWNNTVLRSVDGEAMGIACLGEDITERREAEHKIKRLNRVYAMLSGISTLLVRMRSRQELFAQSCDIAVRHGQFRMAWIGRVDRAAQQVIPMAISGSDPDFFDDIAGRLSYADEPSGMYSLTATVVREKRALVCDRVEGDPRVLLPAKLLARSVASMAVLPLMVAQEVVGVMALFSDEASFFDATEMKLLGELAGDISFALDHLEKADRLNYLAYYDDITTLPNRTLFLDRVNQHMRAREGHRPQAAPFLGVALIDVNRFRIVNDTLGRSLGDELLKLVAQRLQLHASAMDMLARIGVNSFGVAVCEARDASAVAMAVDHLMRACFDEPFQLGQQELRITAKAGVALFPMDGGDAEGLLRNAEAALKKAKASADALLFYTSEMNLRVAEALSLENQLREALERGEFVLHYQPKLHLASGQVTGAEALIRWNDPRRGLVPPGQFIPILEETGLIYEVGRWALGQALADNLRWRAAGLAPIRVAVNVSFLQLRHRAFIEQVRSAVAHDPQAAAGLELEITESMVMDDVEHSTQSLHAIREMGITVAMDDFGTGFSSLSYLARLPLDTLKIDRSFILHLAAGPKSSALVSTIINLGHSLGLKVVAEGVETEEQSALLALLGCDEIQGFFYSRPVPADLFGQQFLRSLQPDAPAL